LIYSFYESVESGLKAILECFKAVLEYFKENINFSEFEEEKIKKLSEEMIDDFDFDVLRDEKNEIQ
jgi:tellurite resistance protein